MEHSVLPSVYATQERKKEEEYEISKRLELSKKIEKKVEEYNNRKPSYSSNLDFMSYAHVVRIVSAILIAIVGIIFFIVSTVTSNMSDTGSLFWIIVSAILCYYLYGFIIAVVIYPIVYPIYYIVCNKSDKKVSQKRAALDKEKEEELEQLEYTCCEEIAEHHRETEQRIAEYLKSFEDEAQKLSVKFSNSALAKEVIQWLSDGFMRTIEAAKRDSNIERIIVPFDFHVGKKEIQSSTGTYNFDKHRCESLSTLLEQAALARAIASQVQLTVIMNYDKDISGTEYRIDITYGYEERYTCSSLGDYITAHLVYSATNGNYKPIQKW